MYIALTALLPLLGGALMPVIGLKTERARDIYTEAVTVLASLGVFAVLLFAPAKELTLFKLNQNFACVFRMDGLGRLFALLVAALWPFASLYAFEYMRHAERTGNFFAFYTIAYGVTLLIACAGNLFTLYIFYECLTVVTLPLVEHEWNKEAFRAGRAYLMYLIGGATLGFAAMIITSCASGGAAFAPGGAVPGGADAGLMRLAFVLAFMGFGAKAALFPLCGWLPKASVAPTPVTALLHAVAVVNAGVFSVARCAGYVFGFELAQSTWAQYVPMALSAFTVLYGAVRAVRETHLKRRLAWSTVSNLSYMLFALSLLTKDGFAAGITHMVFHSLMKIVLFFCAGAVMVKTGKKDIHEMRGLAKRMPFTLAAFAVAGLALTGVPPLAGFTSKYLIITAALQRGGLWAVAGCVSLIISAVLTAVYVFTFLVPAFYAPETGGGEERADMGMPMKISTAAICLMLIAVSLLSGDAVRLIRGL